MEKNANFARIFKIKHEPSKDTLEHAAGCFGLPPSTPLLYPCWGFHFPSPLSLGLIQLKTKSKFEKTDLVQPFLFTEQLRPPDEK